MSKKNKKVIVAMSGGVDSSAAAFLLQKQGYEVIGIFLRLVSGAREAEAAGRRVCRQLGVKFYPLNLKAKFRKEVVDYFLDSYKKGLTPNPCVKCNQFIKFKELLKIAHGLGADFVATGHYARKREITNYKLQIPRLRQGFGGQANKLQITNSKSQTKIFKLYRGKDETKDQSYFLYNLTQEQLKNILFPLGDYAKEQIKKIADKNKLPYLKKESQDICFLSGDHNDFLKESLKLKPGPIKLLTAADLVPPPYEGGGQGEVIGEHKGLPLYTLGQRRGVEIGGTGPYWVAGSDYKKNILYVTDKIDDPALFKDELTARDVNWISGIRPKLPFECLAVIRYGHKGVEAQGTTLRADKEQGSALSVRVKLKKPQRAVTSGQSLVFYLGDEVLGGGVIS